MAKLIKARVLACLPEYGMAVVQQIGGSGTTDQPMVATLPYGGTQVGVTVYQAFAEGTLVQCATKDNDSEFVCDIICAYNDTYDRENTNSDDWIPVLDRLNRKAKPIADVITRLLGKHAGRLVAQSAGAPEDLLPGDYLVMDRQTGSGIEIRRDYAGIRGDGTAAVRAGVDGSVLAAGRSVTVSTPLGERVDTGAYVVDNRAVSPSEAFGLREGAPMEESSDSASGGLRLSDETAIPLYRMQDMGGATVGGYERTIVGFPSADSHTADAPPPVLARTRMSLSGGCSTASALRICSVKAPGIPAIAQLGYGQTAKDEGGFDDLREPYDDNSDSGSSGESNESQQLPDNPSDPDAPIRDAPLYYDSLLSDEYVGKLAERLREYGFVVSRPDGSSGRAVAGSEMPGGSVGGEAYDTPDKMEQQDISTGAKTGYYGTSSFVVQEPDGSICLRDGYGSEIRMSHGNIYISPALDLHLRPGRDLSAMAGRHQSYNSQGTMTLNTSDAMYVRSEAGMKICANTSAEPRPDGGLVIETRGLADVVVRGEGSMSVSCERDLYIGRRSARSGTDAGPAAPAAQGVIVVDAASNGALYANGGTSIMAEADQVDICSIPDEAAGLNSLVSLSGSGMAIAAQEVFAMTNVRVRAPSAPVTRFVPRSGDSVPVRFDTPQGGKENVIIGGDAIVGGGIHANGTVVARKGVAALAVATKNGAVSGMTDEASKETLVKRPTLPVNPISGLPSEGVLPATGSNGASVAVSDRQSMPGTVCSRTYLAQHGFAFPDSYDVRPDIVMPGMSWQERASGRWSERPVKPAGGEDDEASTYSMSYPGASVWHGAKVSMRATAERPEATLAPLADGHGYRINN